MLRLLFLSALWLSAMSVSAAIELIDREVPTAENVEENAVSFQEGKTYILYNVGASMYFAQGSTWSTRGCVVPNKASALPIRVVKYTIADVWDGKTYEIKNYCTDRTTFAWRTASANEGGDIYCDQSGRGASSFDSFVEISDQGSNVYRIALSDDTGLNTIVQGNGSFWGYANADYESSNDTYGFEDATERVPITALTSQNVDWQFYEFTAFDVYDKAMELKKLIETADGQNVSVDAAVDVYNNPSATVEQLQAAIDALNKALSDNTFEGYTPGTALNVTKLIVNPNFSDGDVSGWEGTTWGHGNVNSNVEHYNKVYDTYQNIIGLRPGLYVVGMNGFYRAGSSQESYDKGKADNDDVRNASFYTKSGEEITERPVEQIYSGIQTASRTSGETTVKDGDITYYQPNNGSSAEYYFHTLGLYKNVLFSEVPVSGELTIGVKKDAAISTDWSIFDDFSLVYCGEVSDQAFQAYVDYYKSTFPDYEKERVDASDPFTLTNGVNVSDPVLEAFKSVSATATDEPSARAAMEQIDNAFVPVRENVALWAEFLATAKIAAQQVGDNQSLDQSDALVSEVGDWGKYFAAEEWNAREMSNAELRARIDEMTEKIAQAKLKLVHDSYETIVTNLLTNPDFSSDGAGWTRVAASGGNVAPGGPAENRCYEAWNNANFDIYQVVKDAPEGVYRIEVQGFYRYLRGDNAWNAYKAQESPYVKPGGAPVFVYMNHKATPFKNVFDEPITQEGFYSTQITTVQDDESNNLYFPDGMISSGEAFSHQMYKQSAYGIIRAGQDMRIGVKGTSNQGGDSWVIWDNFQLFNCGKDETALNNVLPEEIENARKMLTNEDGSNKLMGKDIHDALLQAISEAESALGTTGDAMFDALNNLFDAEENVDASVELFSQLAAANDNLMKAIEKYSDSEAAGEAGELYEIVLGNLGEYTYNDSDVPGVLKQIRAMMTKLRMPTPAEYADASAMNPVDFTVVIENPEYDTNGEGVASSDGWDGTVAGVNETWLNAEIFNTSTFDHYQIIEGLPAGKYRVSVMGFYRAGLAANDYAKYNEGADSCDNAILYANAVSTKLPRLAMFASADHAGEDDWVEVEDGSGLYVPNMMATAATLFDEQGDNLVSTIEVTIGSGKELRLGLKKDIGIASDWCLFDTWSLYYLGNSGPAVAGDVNDDGSVDVADISAILTHMAGNLVYDYADVNDDGEVDVADISKVLSIMAGNEARRAQESAEE